MATRRAHDPWVDQRYALGNGNLTGAACPPHGRPSCASPCSIMAVSGELHAISTLGVRRHLTHVKRAAPAAIEGTITLPIMGRSRTFFYATDLTLPRVKVHSG